MRLTLHLIVQPSGETAGFGGDPAVLRRIDASGVDRITVGDAQGNHLECFSYLGYLAGQTERVHIGPFVTNAASRDVGVLAAAAASWDALSNGRAFLALGRGDGVVNNLDLKAQTVQETRESILAIRALLNDGFCSYRGRNVKLSWPSPPGPRVPIYTAPGGPKMLAMSAEICDGLFLATGCTQENLDQTFAVIDATERETPLDLWWVTRFGIGDTSEEALALASEGLTSMGNHSLRGDYGEKGIPEDIRPALAEYHRRYDYAMKNYRRAPDGSSADGLFTNVDLMNELGLRDYFIDRFGVVGSPDEVVERLLELERRGIHSTTLAATTTHELDLICEQVLPRLKRQEKQPA